MARRLAHGLCLLSTFVLMGLAVFTIQTYSTPLVLEITLCTGVTIAVVATLLVCLKKAGGLSFDTEGALEALTLISLGEAISLGAINGLPSIANTHTVYALHLGVVYRVLHYVVTAFVTWRILSKDSNDHKAEVGLVAILVYAAVNGGLFQIAGTGFNLLWGLSLATSMMYLRERVKSPEGGVLPPLGIPALAFLFGVALATATSSYVHQSVAMLLRIGNWVLVYFLIVSIAKRETQLRWLLMVLLIVATVVALAGFWGTVEYAKHLGWGSALGGRLRLGRRHSNGVAVFAVAYATLAFGLLLTWKSRLRRLMSGLAFLALAGCAFLTHCRSAGVGLVVGIVTIALLRMPKSPVPSSRKIRLTLSLGLVVTLLIAISLVATRTLEGSMQTRLILWKVALNELKHSPLTGVGPGTTSIPFFSGILSHEEAEAIKYVVGSHSHNLIVQVGRSLGLIGLALFAVLMFVALRYSLSAIRLTECPSKRGIMTALFGAMVALLIPHLLVLALSSNTLLPISFWIFLGLVVAAKEGSTWNDGPQPASAPAPERLEAPTQRQSYLVASVFIFVAVLVAAVRPVVAEIVLGRDVRARDKETFTGGTVVPKLAILLEPYWAELYAWQGERSTGVEAIREYEKAIKLRPYFAAYHARLGWLYWAENWFDRARSEFEAASILHRHGNEGAQYQHDWGLAQAATGRGEQALEAFQEAVLLNPSILRRPDWTGRKSDLCLSAAYARFARTQRVDADLAALIDIHLGSGAEVRPHSTSRGHPTISLQDVAGGLRASADSAGGTAYSYRALFSLARLYQTQHMWSDMHRALDELDPLTEPDRAMRAEVRILRAWAYRGQGRMSAAENQLRAALLDYDDAVVHAELGRILLRKGKTAEATRQLRQAAESWSPDLFSLSRWSQYWRDLAECHRRSGDLEEALGACDKALFLHLPFPQYARIKMQIADSFYRRQDYDREREIYTTLLGELRRSVETQPASERILTKLVRRMVASHKKQGLLTRDALIQSAGRIAGEGAIGKRYRQLLANEVERQFRTTD